WRSDALRVPFRLEEGMQVVATGTLLLYPARGQFQIQVSELQPIGAGALAIAFEQLRKRLEAEGLFAESRKRPLPALPKRIGIVTSPDGAAVRDILTILERRHPNLHISIFPARVQGESAAADLVRGVNALNRIGSFDVLIVTRGGGSAEDLAPFNDERLVRALASSSIPTISAVGHETDWTLCDQVADLRAPTPSAAAELVVGVQEEIARRVTLARRSLLQMAQRRIAELRSRVSQARQAESLVRFPFILMRRKDRLSAAIEALRAGALARPGRLAARLDAARRALSALDPLGVLQRGYAVVSREDSGLVLRSSRGIAPGTRIRVRLAEGGFRAAVTSNSEEGES
ncbi:MAG: exodeoxyribonuclease VII large subunit, partial [Thermoanaerobaculia bacterium]